MKLPDIYYYGPTTLQEAITLKNESVLILYVTKGVCESAAIENLIGKRINATPVSSEFVFKSIYGDSNDRK
jgi:hypothetical protein